jgi:hypothetical protein
VSVHSAIVLLAATAVSQPPTDLRVRAGQAEAAKKILMVRFEPPDRPDAAQLDQAIAADAELAKAFAQTFEVESRVLTGNATEALHRALGRPFRGVWPGVALVDRRGELMSVVDPASWQTDGKWDAAKVRRFVAFWSTPDPAPPPSRVQECKETYGAIYDPKAAARADIAAAVRRAKAEGKHVLVKVGGNWCGWCYFLHDEFETRAHLGGLLDRSYVLVRVSHDEKNKNEDVLAELGNPQRFGFPVLVVLDAKGTRLHTQDSGLLESGDAHDPRRIEQFLKGWTPEALAPKKKAPKEKGG